MFKSFWDLTFDRGHVWKCLAHCFNMKDKCFAHGCECSDGYKPIPLDSDYIDDNDDDTFSGSGSGSWFGSNSEMFGSTSSEIQNSYGTLLDQWDSWNWYKSQGCTEDGNPRPPPPSIPYLSTSPTDLSPIPTHSAPVTNPCDNERTFECPENSICMPIGNKVGYICDCIGTGYII